MKLIFLSGNAKSGKDLFADNACKYFRQHGLVARKFALADSLKYKLEDFIQDNFGFSSFTKDPSNKELIRPIMISFGCAKRKMSNGRHWIETLSGYIDKHREVIDIGIVTDVRFAEYEDDELKWAKNNGKLIYIDRKLKNGELVKPVCLDEAVNHPIIKDNSDYKFTWETSDKNYQDVCNFLDNNTDIWKK